MSANDPARLQSRRHLLTGTAAVAAVGSAALPALATDPDPIFVALQAEQQAYDALEAASGAWGEAEAALWDSDWHREPRVVVGFYTCFVRGPGYEPIPLAEQVATPVYAVTREAIDKDCDSHAKAPGVTSAEVEVRRARLHRELEEDGAAIAAAPEVVREAEAGRLHDEASNAYNDALAALHAVLPTTAAGLLALIEVADMRTGDGHEASPHLASVIAGVRSVLGGRA